MRRLIVFTRYPVAGQSKTRMIPLLGPPGASRLQVAMTGHTVLNARVACDQLGAALEVRFAGGTLRRLRRWLGAGTPYQPQGRGDLGGCMFRAFLDSHNAGATATVLIGTDCPALTPDILAQAYAALARSDVVLGPAADGGYYLIGMREPHAALFEGMTWGTETVLRDTLSRAERSGLTVNWLPPLSDVDRPEDLPVWDHFGPPAPGRGKERISVIVPVLNEEQHLEATLARTRNAHEVLMVDGGSTDASCTIARDSGARLLVTFPGRHRQMNAGALAASGEILVFLHADTILPEGWEDEVRLLLGRHATAMGAFSLRLARATPGCRIVAAGATLRSRLLGLPYGDQALFMTAARFREMGGYADLPIMEDFDLVRRMRSRGVVRTSTLGAESSARRWERLGMLRTTCINQCILVGYCLGVSPFALKTLYTRETGDRLRP